MASNTDSPLTIPLLPEQDGAGYHTRNGPGELQRPTIIDDLCAGLLLQVELQGAVHGTLSRGGDPATLLVVKFYFQGRTEKRRFRSAEIKIRFADEQQPLQEDPEVLALWPEGDFTFNESQVDLSDSKSGGANLSGGAGAFQMGLNGTWTRTQGRQLKERASINGARRIEGRDWGARNVVRLILDENRGQEGGIVSTLSTAILVKRKYATQRFIAQIEVTAQADMKYATASKIRELSGKTPLNDPVVFDPKCEPTIAAVEDASNLAAESLESLASIISTTVLSTIRGVADGQKETAA
ncbi:hypothetical protein N7462_002423 [Penicillium macrosclerotiorum]|uniref:uncharacterized protein n=1 Tax=Penicillium macrosclerotiorum TaxID=303699 RepID=UPI002548F028|nr:uncharacterized protein N7462_002423 [Penicillium macrosclerotiorum]KAJ5693000.1 hypothetical protein N7462_002423 [Penicillium macrosclerotiorum]